MGVARPPRTELAGGIHHAWNRGNNGAPIFVDDTDRVCLLEELDTCRRRYRWECLSYCLMPNHLHLVVETAEATLSEGMRSLEGRYAQRFNKRHRPKGGHVFQGRFGSALVDSDEYLAHLLRYVSLNPVMAGLCAAPEDWRWSSHRYLLGHDGRAVVSRSRLETLLGGPPGSEGSRYARLF